MPLASSRRRIRVVMTGVIGPLEVVVMTACFRLAPGAVAGGDSVMSPGVRPIGGSNEIF